VINVQPDVAPETRKEILEIIDRLDFRSSFWLTALFIVAVSPKGDYVITT